MENNDKQRNFTKIDASELLSKVKDLKTAGYRLGQACCTKVDEGFEILYSFDKDGVLENVQITIPEDYELQSITGDYWPAFIYENEMHDLFGVKIKNNALDYGGKFFRLSQPTPWNPKN